MRVVIAGGGNVGAYIADDLVQAGHQVSIVEIDADRVAAAQALGDPAGVTWIVADACELSELAKASPETADVVAAVTGDDEDNLVFSLLAKQEFAVPRVVARVNNPKNEGLFNETWGVDVALSVPQLIAGLVEEQFTTGRMVRLFALRDKARLVEVTLDSDSILAEKAITDLELPRAFTFVAVLRDGNVIIPRGDTVFHAGDEVLALVTPESEEEGRHLLTGA